MKYLKMLGLLAVAAAALMAFAGTASATILTSPEGTTYTSTIKATSEGATTLAGSFITVECGHSFVEGTVEQHGASVTAGGKINAEKDESGKVKGLTFSECNYAVTVVSPGSLEIHTKTASADGNGTLTSTGAEISIATSVGTCVFTTNGTDIGTVTGSKNLKGKTATLDIESAAIPRTAGNFLCGPSGKWNGSYEVTTPDYLDID